MFYMFLHFMTQRASASPPGAQAIYRKIRRYSETSVKFVNRMAETAFPHFRTELQQINNRKPDLLEIKSKEKECEIIEVTVCFDLYMPESYERKARKYQQLKKHFKSEWDKDKYKNIVL